MENSRFYCKKCNYYTNIKQNYDKHLISKKHNFLEDNKEVEQEEYKFVCKICNKKYKSNPGLWHHKKKCKEIKKTEKQCSTPALREVILLKGKIENIEKNIENKIENLIINKNDFIELKNMIMELLKKDSSLTTINNTNNFNIAIFLNEQCKNAKNLIDFIKEIPIELNHVLKIGELGYVDGVTKIIKDELKKYSIYERPIHYHITDEREQNTIHIRDEDQWKDDESDVIDVFDKGINTLDWKLDRTFSKHAIDKNMTQDAYNEIKNNTGLVKENSKEQDKIIKNIIPVVKVP